MTKTTLLPARTLLKVMGSVKAAFDAWLPTVKKELELAARQGDDGDGQHHNPLAALAKAAREAVLVSPTGAAGHLVSGVLPAHNLRWCDVQHSLAHYCAAAADNERWVLPDAPEDALLVASACAQVQSKAAALALEAAAELAADAATAPAGGSSSISSSSSSRGAPPAACYVQAPRMVCAIRELSLLARAWLVVAGHRLGHGSRAAATYAPPAFRERLAAALSAIIDGDAGAAPPSGHLMVTALPLAGVRYVDFCATLVHCRAATQEAAAALGEQGAELVRVAYARMVAMLRADFHRIVAQHSAAHGAAHGAAARPAAGRGSSCRCCSVRWRCHGQRVTR